MVRDDVRLGHNTSRRVLWAPPIPTPALLDKVKVHKGHTKEPKSSWVLGFCSHHSRLQILFPHLGSVLNPGRIFPHEFNMTDEACSRGSAAAYGQESVRVSGTGWRRATRLPFVSFFKGRSYTCGTMLTRAGQHRHQESLHLQKPLSLLVPNTHFLICSSCIMRLQPFKHKNDEKLEIL
ncbi:uncharacterized protein LOC123608005 isoform X2 [Leopardus geoffroyi]|uniref:uncharacterized protein LOC123608005 isoform X2 n=1 Tax=Leopardus geoffroyi TaxID=46844 RepID=UPI001E25F1E5|nr:uncharacterized protein LOC123608005 isoform X2 [Leopardus geoffroyi]